jgi:His/Glu/Gln/Arg/opine family amino acid ABC transporter permease subunit
VNTIQLLYESLPLLTKGAGLTLLLWLSSATISLCLGGLCGILRSRNIRIAGLSTALDYITALVRGVPFYVQLLLAYFVIPDMLRVNPSAFACAMISLGLCSAAYVSQIICAGIDVIPEGQWEATLVLGYSRLQTLWYVVIPQVVRTILPPLSGELDQLLKSTSIVSSIGIFELTRAALNIISIHMQPVPVYMAIAVVYLIMSLGLQALANILLRRLL